MPIEALSPFVIQNPHRGSVRSPIRDRSSPVTAGAGSAGSALGGGFETAPADFVWESETGLAALPDGRLGPEAARPC